MSIWSLQAYERDAIERHLAHHSTDPLTNTPLTSKSITPVYVLKSRALDYRETTARECIERACSPVPPAYPPVAYLRRAVELCADANFLPQGLTREVAGYVLSHPSNAYDRLALELFAKGLQDNGYYDRASCVYFHLMVGEEDMPRQAEMLRHCLACWQGGRGASSRESSAAELSVKDGSSVDDHVFEKLVVMLAAGRTSFAWIVDVAGEANLGLDFVCRLCEQLLFPPFPLTPGAGSDGAEPLPWQYEKEILVKFTRVLTHNLQRRADEVEAAVRRMDPGRSGNGRLVQQRVMRDDGVGENAVASAVGALLRHPLLVAPCIFLAATADRKNVLLRVVNCVPLLALLVPRT